MVTVGRWERFWERALSVFKYIVAGYMMLAGALTTFSPPDSTVQGSMHVIYGVQFSISLIGIIIFLSGLGLMIGKIKKSRRLTGRGLFATYLCFFFATFLNALAYNGDPTTWVSNAIMAIIMALLWLRWKFKTEYVNPKHFIDDTTSLRPERK